MTYKLTYFNVRGLAEPIRFLLSYMDIDFEDVRVDKEQWPSVKPGMFCFKRKSILLSVIATSINVCVKNYRFSILFEVNFGILFRFPLFKIIIVTNLPRIVNRRVENHVKKIYVCNENYRR